MFHRPFASHAVPESQGRGAPDSTLRRMRRMTRSLFNCTCLLLSFACLGAEDTEPLRSGQMRTWELSPNTLLEIGGEGARETEFHRLAGVTVIAGGQLMVADGGSGELRIFARDGRYLRSVSRRGSGPGEFQHIAGLARAGDTVIVLDGATGDLSSFSEDGRFLGRVRMQGGGPFDGWVVHGRFRNGSMLVSRGMFRQVRPQSGSAVRDSVRLGIIRHAADDDAAWLGVFPAGTFVGFDPPNGAGPVAMALHPFGPQLVTGASGDHAWIGDSGDRVIMIYDASGNRVSSISWPDSARAFDGAALERARIAALENSSDERDRRFLEFLHSDAIRPRFAPHFMRFVPGPDGEMWIERFREDERSPAEYLVFDRAGTPIGAVALPPRMRLHEAGVDYVTGVVHDEADVESVVKYRLRRR
jgi:hypothetical protein